MVQPPDRAKRQCPTRIDGGDALICHQIDLTLCQRRQREHYHKCHVCTHRNDAGVPRVEALPPAPGAAAPKPQSVPLRVHRAG